MLFLFNTNNLRLTMIQGGKKMYFISPVLVLSNLIFITREKFNYFCEVNVRGSKDKN